MTIMNLDLVRNLDFWIGTPLCFFLSLWALLSRPFRPDKNEPKTVRKILFIKLSELGATVLAYPLLHRVKNENPSSEFFFLTFSKNKNVFKLLDGIIPDQNILEVRENLFLFSVDCLSLIRRLWKEEIDVVFDLEFFARISVIFAYLSRAKKRIGFHHYFFEGLYRGELLTHRFQYNPLSHIAKSYWSLAEGLSEKEKRTPELKNSIVEDQLVFPTFVSKDELRKKISAQLFERGISPGGKHKLFLMNAGEGTLPLREWPLENFIALSRKLLDQEQNRILFIGTEGTSKKEKLILETLAHPRCLSWVNQTSLEELLELFCLSDALISNDGGLAHFAMLTPIKKFVFFGPESPKVFGPLGKNNHIFYSRWPCSPCFSVLNHRNSACQSNECLKVITPEEVFDRIEKTLAQ